MLGSEAKFYYYLHYTRISGHYMPKFYLLQRGFGQICFFLGHFFFSLKENLLRIFVVFKIVPAQTWSDDPHQ